MSKWTWEGLKITPEEHHMLVCGWGDGAGLNKAEKIPTLEETTEKYEPTDFYAILAREAWYYKLGVGLGRLTWALVIVLIVFLLS